MDVERDGDRRRWISRRYHQQDGPRAALVMASPQSGGGRGRSHAIGRRGRHRDFQSSWCNANVPTTRGTSRYSRILKYTPERLMVVVDRAPRPRPLPSRTLAPTLLPPSTARPIAARRWQRRSSGPVVRRMRSAEGRASRRAPDLHPTTVLRRSDNVDGLRDSRSSTRPSAHDANKSLHSVTSTPSLGGGSSS